jgi:hypothetical protein
MKRETCKELLIITQEGDEEANLEGGSGVEECLLLVGSKAN